MIVKFNSWEGLESDTENISTYNWDISIDNKQYLLFIVRLDDSERGYDDYTIYVDDEMVYQTNFSKVELQVDKDDINWIDLITSIGEKVEDIWFIDYDNETRLKGIKIEVDG